MKKTNKRIQNLTTREAVWGKSNAEKRKLAGVRPKRKLGGVSDLHIEQMENETPEETEARELADQSI